ncbi:unnamed protein product [Rhizophagus irregularis]|nr:unnamed protein product [Rhizophagus irregularis]
MDDFDSFENVLTNWINFFLENSNDKDPKKILKIMESHKENKSWFTSLIGYFYQFDKNQLHLIVVKNNDALNLLRNSNTIIGKYFIFFYYKDIILSGNLDAQYNLAIFYMDGIGTTKRRKKAFDLFLKSIQLNKSRVHRNKMRSKFEMDLESAISNNSIAQNRIGYHFQYGKEE